MKPFFFSIAAAVLLAAAFAGAASAAPPIGAPVGMTFSDGAVGTTYDHCGDTDLCATIRYPNGQELFVYSEGAQKCHPYILDFVRRDGDHTLYQFSRMINHEAPHAGLLGVGASCGNSINTEFTMDHGLIHLIVGELRDGTLRSVFKRVGK